ncbi:hypothetical protein F2Q70_00013117 [Brassica cretica]|uniref:Uncharacterized protein n=1 Tax=Brassica cretica TaxID=69181 RepID=A0A8S9ME26_BRACR|nr:hypothetical protein F2Q70_00013117 [Brassica cretica]
MGLVTWFLSDGDGVVVWWSCGWFWLVLGELVFVILACSLRRWHEADYRSKGVESGWLWLPCCGVGVKALVFSFYRVRPYLVTDSQWSFLAGSDVGSSLFGFGLAVSQVRHQRFLKGGMRGFLALLSSRNISSSVLDGLQELLLAMFSVSPTRLYEVSWTCLYPSFGDQCALRLGLQSSRLLLRLYFDLCRFMAPEKNDFCRLRCVSTGFHP